MFDVTIVPFQNVRVNVSIYSFIHINLIKVCQYLAIPK